MQKWYLVRGGERLTKECAKARNVKVNAACVETRQTGVMLAQKRVRGAHSAAGVERRGAGGAQFPPSTHVRFLTIYDKKVKGKPLENVLFICYRFGFT